MQTKYKKIIFWVTGSIFVLTVICLMTGSTPCRALTNIMRAALMFPLLYNTLVGSCLGSGFIRGVQEQTLVEIFASVFFAMSAFWDWDIIFGIVCTISDHFICKCCGGYFCFSNATNYRILGKKNEIVSYSDVAFVCNSFDMRIFELHCCKESLFVY